MTIELHRIPAEDFEALVGAVLPCRIGTGEVELAIEAVWRSPYPTNRPLPGFSVFLRGPVGTALAQGMYRFRHPQHGELDVFMTPVARDGMGMRYEVVFN